jgi:hypothetical protein
MSEVGALLWSSAANRAECRTGGALKALRERENAASNHSTAFPLIITWLPLPNAGVHEAIGRAKTLLTPPASN